MGRRRHKPGASTQSGANATEIHVPDGHELVTFDVRERACVERAEALAQANAVNAYRATILKATKQIADVRGFSEKQVAALVRTPVDGKFLEFPLGDWRGFLILKNPPEPLPQPQKHDHPKEASP